MGVGRRKIKANADKQNQKNQNTDNTEQNYSFNQQ